MKAIILAAGKGKRLIQFTQNRPKSLIPIGGTTLLSRSIHALTAVGISEIIIVVGYLHEIILQHLKACHPQLKIQTIINPEYTRGSILSLWAARNFFHDDLLIMDADVLFPKQFLSLLLDSPHPDLMLFDPNSKSQGEEQMLLIKNHCVIESTKKVQGKSTQDFDEIGEGIGFLKLSVASAKILKSVLKEFIENLKGDLEYEDCFKNLFQKIKVYVQSVEKIPWVEIDFPEDVRKAESIVLPNLLKYESENP